MQSSLGTKSTPIIQPVQRRRPRYGRIFTIVLFLLPAAAVYIYFVILPIGQSVFYSLFRWNGLGPLENFIGLDNYTKALGDKVFVGALSHNLLIAVLSIVIQLPLSLVLALLVARHLPGRSVFRMIFFLPYVLSDVTTGVIWSFVYKPDNGLLNTALRNLNLGDGQAWLGTPNLALYAVFVVMCWKYFGFHLILYVAGLQQIPADLEEAAKMDGASNFQVLRHITVPLLGGTIRISVFLSILGALQYFDLIWVMTLGGPVNASETMATYMIKNGFQRFQLGYGSAVGVILFLVCFVFSLAYQRMVLHRDLAGSGALT
ncbi:MAG: sugar ABC transporter permease [Chloroflexi bacterium]|nr:sugar ABC transporter permease [Chloroflexota bacterium]OJW06555.1 MAG: sugar ABC transporter permease [Chloroflexi bacterium 54-19]